jgi:hypothetical protein
VYPRSGEGPGRLASLRTRQLVPCPSKPLVTPHQTHQTPPQTPRSYAPEPT